MSVKASGGPIEQVERSRSADRNGGWQDFDDAERGLPTVVPGWFEIRNDIGNLTTAEGEDGLVT